MNTTELTHNQLLNDLQQFYGTEAWYRISPFTNVVITDGVKFFAEKCNCFWLFQDFIGLEGYKAHKAEPDRFTVVNVVVTKSHSVQISFTHDTGEKPYWTSHVKDVLKLIPIGEYRFYLIDNVVLLPSEY